MEKIITKLGGSPGSHASSFQVIVSMHPDWLKIGSLGHEKI